MKSLLRVELRRDHDAVVARQAARDLARRLGFEHHDQIRIATAVSELARAALAGGEGVAELGVDTEHAAPLLVISVTGESFFPAKRTSRRRACHEGVVAARRLLEAYETPGTPGTIALSRPLPPGRFRLDCLHELHAELAQISFGPEAGYDAELHRQNLELSATLFELEQKQRELTRLNAELADTNRGVMALYAELDERANQLRETDETKTRFFSSMSHELRTPLNSVLALSKLLLGETDGPLNEEQAKQVRLIHDAAQELYEIVSDLLDLSKVEAGKSKVGIGRFSVARLFGALRGMVRPLLPEGAVTLELEAPEDLPDIVGDEAKVGQVLRNFLSNAAKFTEAGTIRVAARKVAAGEAPVAGRAPPDQESILFSVADTGIGIAPEDQEAIFDEFTQVANVLQRRVRGTGLGLPLCRRIASLLGGRIWVESELGVGSTFYFLLPRFYRPELRMVASESAREHGRGVPKAPADPGIDHALGQALGQALGRVMLVDDDETFRTILTKLAAPLGASPVPVADAELALQMARSGEADALILDLMMPELDGLTFLTRARDDPKTRRLPILVCSSKSLSSAEQSLLDDLGAAFLPKEALDSEHLAEGLVEARARAPKASAAADRLVRSDHG